MNRDIDPAVQSTVHFYAAAQKKGKGPTVIITADPCKHVMDMYYYKYYTSQM
jgi:hypothetical protein